MSIDDAQPAAATIGRDIGSRAPTGLRDSVLKATLVRAVDAAVPSTFPPREAYPSAPRTGRRWLVYIGLWVIIGIVAAIENQVGEFPEAVRVILGILSTLLILAGVVLYFIGRSAKRSYEAKRDTLIGEARAQVMAAAVAEATRPGRIGPAHTLSVVVPPPAAQPYGVSHRGAEHLAAEWMQHFGAKDATVTRYSADGGIDVVSSSAIAQVKNLAEGASVPVAQVRELAGVAAHDGRRALFFTSGGYTAEGIAFADRAGIALFRYDAVVGSIAAANDHARVVAQHGLSPAL